MLQQVLNEIQAAQGAVDLNALARKLGIERSALDGMVQFWVRKGRLKMDDDAPAAPDSCSSAGVCGHTCPGPTACPFVMALPRTYSLQPPESK